jgi:hypothetical protein
MTQPLASDFPIDPTTTSGTALADILNRFSDSVNTSNSGATPPPDTTPGMVWLDTSTTPPTMRIRNAANTGWNTIPVSGGATGSPFLLPDGTVAAPGLAWASEPGLGLYRFGASQIGMAAQGVKLWDWNFSHGTNTYAAMYARGGAGGATQFSMTNQPAAATNYNYLALYQNADGAAILATRAVGTAVRGNLTLDAPTVLATGDVSLVGNLTAGTVFGNNGMGFWGTSGEQMMHLSGNFTGSVYKLSLATATGTVTLFTNGQARAIWTISDNNFTSTGTAKKPGGGSWTDSSDARIKQNVENYTSGLDVVLGLRPVTYNFTEETERDTSILYTGLIAQECEQAMPEMVTTAPGKVGTLEFDDMRTLDTSALIYALVNAVREVHEKVQTLLANRNEGTTS